MNEEVLKIITFQTDTWPTLKQMELKTNSFMADFMEHIYKNGNITEVDAIMQEFEYCGGVGHIVLIGICSLIDSVSAFFSGGGNVGYRFTGFITKYFSAKYLGKEEMIYKAFRCDGVHGWNLQRSKITGKANDEEHLVVYENGVICLSLYDFFNDFIKAFEKYIIELRMDDNLKLNFLKRYKEIKPEKKEKAAN